MRALAQVDRQPDGSVQFIHIKYCALTTVVRSLEIYRVFTSFRSVRLSLGIERRKSTASTFNRSDHRNNNIKQNSPRVLDFSY